MPLGTYYEVTGSDPTALDIRRAAPVQREARPSVDDQDVPLMRDQYEQFRKEYDNALAILEARMKNIRPWETPEQLQAEIIKPIADKWRQVPGFQGSAGIEIERMRQSADARNAARQMVQQQSVARDREAMMNSGASETQATIQAALRNNLTGAASGFKFPGFFYAGKNDGLGEMVAHGAWEDAKAAAEAEWNLKHPAAKQEAPSVASVPVMDANGNPIKGVYGVPAASGKGFTIHNVPSEKADKDPLAEYQLDLKKDELKELKAARDRFKSLMPDGEPTEEAIAKMGPLTKRNFLKFKDAEQRIQDLQQEIEQLLNEGRPTSATTNAPVGTNWVQSGAYRYRVVK